VLPAGTQQDNKGEMKQQPVGDTAVIELRHTETPYHLGTEHRVGLLNLQYALP
jgi:hypothetical protein